MPEGQLVIKDTSKAILIPVRSSVNGFILKAKSTNTGKGFIGGPDVTTTDDGTGNGYPIAAGESYPGAASNVGQRYLIGTAVGDIFYFTGS